MTVLDKIKAASPARTQVKVVLNAALLATHQELQDQWVKGTATDADAADDAQHDLAERMEAVTKQMAASEVTFIFERLEWTRRLMLPGEHPVRVETVDGVKVENPDDKEYGFNRYTFEPALIRESCVEIRDATSVVERADLGDDVWEPLFQNLNAATVDQLFTGALSANDLGVRIPISAPALSKSQANGGSSKPRGPGVSPRAGSKAGSRRTTRKSSATAAPVKSSGT